ncbi:hypothetical protein RDABS01_031172 [Bienertia sinuspersici]
MQLVNVVPMSLHVYLAQIFLIPKTFIKMISSICRSFYGLIRGEKATQKGGYVTWEGLATLKHRFIAWLLFRICYLPERCYKMGVAQEDRCLICGADAKTVAHLFWNYPYAKQCFQQLYTWMEMKRCKQSLYEFSMWCRRKIKGLKLQRKVVLATCLAVVYHIWKARNQDYGSIRT